MRALFVIGLIGLATAATAEPVPYGSESVSFRSLPPIVDPGALNPHVRYVGGYEITAHGTSQVNGLSDLQLTPDGDGLKVEAISDLGAGVTFTLRPDGKGALLDSPVKIELLRDEEGRTAINRDSNDAEDIAVDPATGERFVSFERFQRIMAYAPGTAWGGTPRKLPLGGLPVFPNNEGMEGLSFFHEPAGNGLLIGVEAGGFWRCPLSTYDCTSVSGPAVPGFLYKLSSLAPMPDDDHAILALYRYYDPFTGPRNVVSLLRLEGDTLVKVADLARVTPPLPYDNYEGVAALKTATGYRLYLICDGLHEADKPKILMFDWTK